MKMNVTLDLNIKMGWSDPSGTSCIGYLPPKTKYSEVVKVFGKPQVSGSGDGKMQVEWIGKINNQLFTIYDYKTDGDYKGNTNWHIGAKAAIVADLVTAYFINRKK